MKEGEAEFFLKIFENFSGLKQFVKLNPVDLKSLTLKYVFKSSQNMIIWLTLNVVLLKIAREEFLSPLIHWKSFGTLEKGAPDLY